MLAEIILDIANGMAKKPNFDLLICGGGVIGLSIAFECATHGRRVAILEANRIGQASSWAGAGILPAGATNQPLDPLEQLKAISHSLHEAWHHALLELTGIDNEYRACGGIYVGRTPAERATLAANRLWWEEHGIPYSLLSRDELNEHAPFLDQSSELNQAWWLPTDCRIRNPRHIRALESACKILGVHVFENHDVKDISFGSHWNVQTATDVFCAEQVCIASGAWTVKLLNQIGVASGIMPVRGQMVLYKLAAKPFDCVINDGHRYLVPREDGYILAGSCEEEVGFVIETSESRIKEIRDWAETLCPLLGQSSLVKVWAGLRPGSFDSYPYMGSLPGKPGLYVASGHFRNGLHWSTGTAKLMYECMFEQKTSIPLAPFQVLRGSNMLSV